MIRLLFKLVICVVLASAIAAAWLGMRSGEPVYTIHEWLSPQRFQQYDELVRSVATTHQLDPMLLKAVVWRESKFDPRKMGGSGERGLMQVSEIAAKEWAKETRVTDFRAEDLFDPKTNLEAGAWYLHRALQRWQREQDPLPFALAEYNAEPNAGPVAIPRSFPRMHFERTSIFPARANMWIRLSSATNSTSDAGECERAR